MFDRKFKLLKWWSQSFLVGTRQIQCGWRDDDGLVSDLQTFNVKDIPKTAVDWRPNCCANFLSSFLSLLVLRITQDDLHTVHRVSWSPGQDIQVIFVLPCVYKDNHKLICRFQYSTRTLNIFFPPGIKKIYLQGRSNIHVLLRISQVWWRKNKLIL